MTAVVRRMANMCAARTSWPVWVITGSLLLLTALISLVLRRNGFSSWANHFLGWLELDAADDSWSPMRSAQAYLAEAADAAQLYTDVFFEIGTKFQYAPTSLLALEVLDLAWGRPFSTADFGVLNALLLILNVLAVGMLGWMLARQEGRRDLGCVGFALGCVAALCYYPLLKAYTLGQLQVWINLLFALACLGWAAGLRGTAGLLLGLVVLLKPQFALFGLWALWRGERRFLAFFAATAGAGILASIIRYGWGVHFAYVDVLRFLSRTGEAFHANQSVNGLLNRLLGTADSLTWSNTGFPAYHPLVHYGTMVFGLALLFAAWRVFRHPADRARPAGLVEFQSVALVATLGSPIAWEHHYGGLPALYIAMFMLLASKGNAWSGRAKWILLASSYLLTSASLPPLWERWPESPGNLLQSHLLAGALLLLGMQWWFLVTQRKPSPAPTPGFS